MIDRYGTVPPPPIPPVVSASARQDIATRVLVVLIPLSPVGAVETAAVAVKYADALLNELARV